MRLSNVDSMAMIRVALVVLVMVLACSSHSSTPASGAGSNAAGSNTANAGSNVAGSDTTNTATNAGSGIAATAGSSAAGSGAVNAGSKAMPMPDPITKPLSESEARSEATRLARASFERRTDLKDASGARVRTATFEASRWTVKHVNKRWQLDIDPPAGASAHVKFGDFGEKPEVSVDYATE